MRRTLAALLATCALGATAHATAPAPPPPPREARWAATWLAGRVKPGGYVTALDGKPDLATSVVIGIALAAAGVAPRTLDAIAAYAAAHVDDYAVANGRDRPGALGRLALLAAASGRDPNAFGGHRLVDRILATQTSVGPEAGLFADPVYHGTFSHALGLLGVSAARALTADQRAARDRAIAWLRTQQCADGGWQQAPRPVLLDLALTECAATGSANGPDTNTAAFAAQALAAHGAAPARDALGWFAAARNPQGGWGYAPRAATDADSTALVVQAIGALGGTTDATKALLVLQIRCSGAKADRGAFAYQRGADGKLRPNVYATAEAVPAVAHKPFPLTRPAATVARAPLPC